MQRVSAYDTQLARSLFRALAHLYMQRWRCSESSFWGGGGMHIYMWLFTTNGLHYGGGPNSRLGHMNFLPVKSTAKSTM